MTIMHRIFLIFLIFSIGCSNQDFTSESQSLAGAAESSSDSSKQIIQNESSDRVLEAKADNTDHLSGSVTIGNGNNNDDEIDEEISEPVIIIGSYLTCFINNPVQVTCESESELKVEDQHLVSLHEEDGRLIPRENQTSSVYKYEKYHLIIVVTGGFEVSEIREVTNTETESTNMEGGPVQEENQEVNNQETAASQPSCSGLGGGSWVLVPGNTFYNTQDFCLMKYEAKNTANQPVSQAQGLPLVSVTQAEARASCSASGFHLITNEEWMTVTTNIASQASNWSGNGIGDGVLARGHSDGSPNEPCAASENDANSYVEGNDCTALPAGAGESDEATQRRTHVLSNGEVVWDISANVYEWVDKIVENPEVRPGPVNFNSVEYTEIVENSDEMPLTDLVPTIAFEGAFVWGTAQSIGQFLVGDEDAAGPLPMYRGGDWNNGDQSGVFNADLDATLNTESANLGFRCVTAPILAP